MTTYVDSSALLKRYVEEPDSSRADELLAADDALVTARHTLVEVRRNLARLLPAPAAAQARAAFASDLAALSLIELLRPRSWRQRSPSRPACGRWTPSTSARPTGSGPP